MYTDSEFKQAVKNSNNIRQVCKLLKITPSGGNYQVIKNKIKDLNLDTSHFGTKSLIKPKTYFFKLEEVLIKGSFYTNVTALKKRLLSEGCLEEKCSNCNKSTYDINGEIIKMPLELHHIDGDRYNNDLSNLILLCPVCHYLTKNFRGKNKRQKQHMFCQKCNKQINKNKYGLCRDCYVKQYCNDKKEKCSICGKQINKNKTGYCRYCYNQMQININKPSKEVLEQQIQKYSFVFLSKKYKVSDNTIRKWCIKYNIDLTKRKIKHEQNFL